MKTISSIAKKTLVGTVIASSLFGAVQAQEKFPSRPIEIIVTFGPGGGADAMGRKMSQLLEPVLKVPLPVSNIAGASGNAGLTKLVTNPADGYTVATMIALSVSSWAAGLGTAKPEDFAIVAVTQNSPSMLFVPMDSPFKTFKDLLNHTKTNPGALKVATSGYGTQDDITLMYLTSQGYKMTNVPFAKPAERYSSPLGKHTDAIYEEPGDVAQFITGKQLRPLVVFDDERHASFPDVPTSKEHGFNISDLPNFRTIAVPAKTPKDRIDALAAAVNTVMDSAEWKKFCAETYTCVAKRYTPAEAQVYVKNFYVNTQNYLKNMKK